MKISKILTALLLCTAIIITQTSCAAKEKEPVSDTVYNLLNTTCTITIYDDIKQTDAQKLIDETFSLCKAYESKLSKTIEGSDVYKVNHSNGKPVLVSGSTADLVQKGIYYGQLSEGRFDITVGRLSNLWNFNSDNPKVPSEQEILEATKTIDYTKIHLEQESVSGANQNQEIGGKVWIEDPNAELDLGGIAKGYIADRVSDYLVDKGVKSAIVNLGGNIVAIGTKKDGSAWNIGVEKPFSGRRQIVGSVQVKNKTVVTSGIYERMFKENGVLYHHILDVKTGYPAETDVEAVTLVADFGKSVDCDALSTTCLMLGVKKGTALIESIDGIEAAFIDKNGNISITSGMDFIPAK
ncbi:FAD:protein FMN transferase [Aminipila sp.]|uniref:FAD:protein FMN transferase n=1 Tax=Aminipila sp. TaxID=2060095 RepID=UPI0028A209F0|nr:FAD:protein FMN transferase [Aminipila sp.]